jgi:hypothetical protein
MKWTSRILGVINGGLFAYWCGIGSDNPNWWLWSKFMLVSSLAFMAGNYYHKGKTVIRSTQAQR